MQAFFPTKEDFENTVENSLQKIAENTIRDIVRSASGKQYYTIPEVCEKLDVSRRHLQYLRDSGQIGYVKNGRKIYFRAQDLEEFFETNYIPAEKDYEE